jgi:hypothetical protein
MECNDFRYIDIPTAKLLVPEHSSFVAKIVRVINCQMLI